MVLVKGMMVLTLYLTLPLIMGLLWSLRWRHNDHYSVSNHQPHGCLFNRLFRRRWKKTSKLRVTGLCVGNSPGPVNSPHKEPVTRKMFPFDDVIMIITSFKRALWKVCSSVVISVWNVRSCEGVWFWRVLILKLSINPYYILCLSYDSIFHLW